MKILSIILLLSICACKTTKNSAGNSSPLKTETITIDFADLGKSTLKKKAAKGSLVQLEVKNFNRNQYTVAINNTQNNFFVTQPDIFKTLNPATLDVTEKTLEKEISGSSFSSGKLELSLKEDISLLSKHQTALSDNLTLFQGTLEQYKKTIEILKSAIRLKNLLEGMSKDCSGEIANIMKKADEQVTAFIEKHKAILPGVVGTTHAELAANLNVIITEALESSENNYKKLKELSDKIQDLLTELQSAGAQLTASTNRLQPRKGLNAAQVDSVKEVTLLILERVSTKAKRDVAKVVDIMRSVESANTFVDGYVMSNEQGKLLEKYSMFEISNFTIKSAEILEKDELVFDLLIQPKPGISCQNSPIQTLHAPIRVRARGGFKIDFSSGLLLNFGKNDFFNQTYRLDDVENDPNSYKIVKNNNRNKVLPTLGALLHGYIRTGGDLQPAVTLGLSLSAGETSRVNYHFGVSMLLGTEQRIVASFGWTLAQATILDGKYREGQVLPKNSAPQTIETASYYRWGNFFSLSYNLTR